MEDNSRPDTRLLYHYTDFTALDGIVNERELRVNNVLNMNDAVEMELFITGVFSAVENQFSPEKDAEILLQLQRMLQGIRKRLFDYSVYAACFSGYRDDASQWERYANRGKGVCLSFRKPILEKMTGGALSLQKVFYQDDLQSHPLVGQIYDLLRNNRKIEDSPALRETVREARRNCASFKHPSFKSENETRLILMPYSVPDFELKPRYHVAKERIKKYYPLDLDVMCQKAGVTIEDLIAEIMIGPESTQSVPILQDYLKDLGLNNLAGCICHSDCPLRSKI